MKITKITYCNTDINSFNLNIYFEGGSFDPILIFNLMRDGDFEGSFYIEDIIAERSNSCVPGYNDIEIENDLLPDKFDIFKLIEEVEEDNDYNVYFYLYDEEDYPWEDEEFSNFYYNLIKLANRVIKRNIKWKN